MLGRGHGLWAAVGHRALAARLEPTVETRDHLDEILKGGFVTRGIKPRAHFFLKSESSRPLRCRCKAAASLGLGPESYGDLPGVSPL